MLDTTRRAVLRTGARGLAAGAVGGLAGCSELPAPGPLGDGSDPFGDVAAPARGPAGYRNFVPEKPPIDRPLLFVSRFDVSALDRPWLSPETVARLVSHARGGRDYLGIAREATETVTRIGFDATVVRGRFSPDSVGRTLVRSGYERAGDHGGFAVFERPGDDRSVAVGSRTVVWTGSRTPTDYATRVVDAARGAGPRLADADDAFRRLTGMLGTGTTTDVSLAGGDAGSDRPLDRRTASGFARTFTPDGTYVTSLYLFDGDPPTVAAARDALRERQAVDEFRRVEVHRGDRTVRVDALVADDDSGSEAGPRPPVVPRITLGFDHDPDAGTVTVTHEAGDHALARRLSVVAAGAATDRQFEDRYVTVTPGDDLTVEPPAHARSLRVTWDADVGTAIGWFPLPDDGS